MNFRSVACGALLGAGFLLTACKHAPDAKARQSAEIHNDLAVGSLNQGDYQSAYAEFQEAVKIDDTLPEAHNGMGLVLHLNFHKLPEAEAQYKRALELRPAFAEANVNLGNLYLTESRYDEAIAQYELALNDMLYRTPYFAQSNLGWALYKKGQTDKAIESVRAAVTTAPNFCQGWKTLGLIYDGTGRIEKSCEAFGEFTQACSTVAEAHQLLGVCQAKLGHTDPARVSFALCVERAAAGAIHDDCANFLARLGGPLPSTSPHPAPPPPSKP